MLSSFGTGPKFFFSRLSILLNLQLFSSLNVEVFNFTTQKSFCPWNVVGHKTFVFQFALFASWVVNSELNASPN